MLDWSQLDRESIIQLLFGKRHILTKKMPFKKFFQKFSYQIKKFARVKITVNYDNKIDKDVIFVGGSYDSELDQDNKISISIDLYYNKKFKTVDLSEISYFNFCVTVADVLIHEIIHMRQHRKRNYKNVRAYYSQARSEKKRDIQNYLGHKDEIEAYSFNIACELIDKFKEDEAKVKTFLNGGIRIKTNKMACFRQYVNAFDKDWNHPVMVSLKKQIISNIPKAQIGKPFRNNYWIWY